MAEELNPELQEIADKNAAMRQALEERDAAAQAALEKRADAILKDLVKQRAKEAKG
jgi:hypothetical protein